MNIFAVDPDPVICAQTLDDLRLNKMILETAQMLSTFCREYHYKDQAILEYIPFYKSTHKNHPCNIWISQDYDNYDWMYKYLRNLLDEFCHRRRKIHSCNDLFYYFPVPVTHKLYIPKSFPNCTTYKDEPDVHKAYKLYLKDKWKNDIRPPTWTRRNPPGWLICGVN